MRLYFSLLSVAVLSLSCAARNSGGAAQVKLPPPQPAMERQVQNARDAGDGDYQIRVLRQRMAKEPDNLEVRLALAQRYQAMGSTELALEHYRLAAVRFPENPDIHLLLAKTLRRVGSRGEATNMLQEFLREHPQQSPDFQSLLGILLDEQKQFADGEKAHREALAIAPKSDSLHNNLGYNLLMQGKNDAAAGEFQEALKLNPRSQVARNNLGMALANKPDQTSVSWPSVGDPAAAHNNRAAMLIQQGNYAEARKELDIALGYNRNYPAALNNLKLVSELDGKPASITAKPVQSRWGRLKTGLRKAFIYDEVETQPSSSENSTPENRRGL